MKTSHIYDDLYDIVLKNYSGIVFKRGLADRFKARLDAVKNNSYQFDYQFVFKINHALNVFNDRHLVFFNTQRQFPAYKLRRYKNKLFVTEQSARNGVLKFMDAIVAIDNRTITEWLVDVENDDKIFYSIDKERWEFILADSCMITIEKQTGELMQLNTSAIFESNAEKPVEHPAYKYIDEDILYFKLYDFNHPKAVEDLLEKSKIDEVKPPYLNRLLSEIEVIPLHYTVSM